MYVKTILEDHVLEVMTFLPKINQELTLLMCIVLMNKLNNSTQKP